MDERERKVEQETWTWRSNLKERTVDLSLTDVTLTLSRQTRGRKRITTTLNFVDWPNACRWMSIEVHWFLFSRRCAFLQATSANNHSKGSMSDLLFSRREERRSVTYDWGKVLPVVIVFEWWSIKRRWSYLWWNDAERRRANWTEADFVVRERRCCLPVGGNPCPARSDKGVSIKRIVEWVTSSLSSRSPCSEKDRWRMIDASWVVCIDDSVVRWSLSDLSRQPIDLHGRKNISRLEFDGFYSKTKKTRQGLRFSVISRAFECDLCRSRDRRAPAKETDKDSDRWLIRVCSEFVRSSIGSSAVDNRRVIRRCHSDRDHSDNLDNLHRLCHSSRRNYSLTNQSWSMYQRLHSEWAPSSRRCRSDSISSPLSVRSSDEIDVDRWNNLLDFSLSHSHSLPRWPVICLRLWCWSFLPIARRSRRRWPTASRSTVDLDFLCGVELSVVCRVLSWSSLACPSIVEDLVRWSCRRAELWSDHRSVSSSCSSPSRRIERERWELVDDIPGRSVGSSRSIDIPSPRSVWSEDVRWTDRWIEEDRLCIADDRQRSSRAETKGRVDAVQHARDRRLSRSLCRKRDSALSRTRCTTNDWKACRRGGNGIRDISAPVEKEFLYWQSTSETFHLERSNQGLRRREEKKRKKREKEKKQLREWRKLCTDV